MKCITILTLPDGSLQSATVFVPEEVIGKCTVEKFGMASTALTVFPRAQQLLYLLFHPTGKQKTDLYHSLKVKGVPKEEREKEEDRLLAERQFSFSLHDEKE